MKIKNFFIISSVAAILAFGSQLSATGLGAYGTFGKGSIKSTVTHEETDREFDESYDLSKMGIGFLLDTNVARDNLFNYRLQIGYAKTEMEESGYSIDGAEFHLYNTFGFGVFRSSPARVWLGPQIGINYMKGEYDGISAGNDDPNAYYSFAIAAGVVLGVNFHIGDAFSIGLDGGYRASGNFGASKLGKDAYGEDNIYTFTGSGKEGFIDICFMFRIGDVFESEY